MTRAKQIARDIRAVRGALDALTVETSLLRLRRTLRRKYSPEQPRAPAGQPDGGRWTSGEGATDTETSPLPSEERVVTPDGTEVLTLRIHADRGDWDERYTVTGANGDSRIFETSGMVQTIRDGADGTVLGRSIFTPTGVEPVAGVEPAFLPAIPAAIEVTLQLAGALFAVLAARDDGFGTAVFGMSAQEYKLDTRLGKNPAIWVGRVDQATLDAACPRNGEVQAMADQVAARIRASGSFTSAQDLGNKIHAAIAKIVNGQGDPNFRAELSVSLRDQFRQNGEFRLLFLDIYERPIPTNACVYDHKTGRTGLSPSRAIDLATAAMRHFPGTTRVIVIQVRPRP